jgi:hypothetical protein
MATSADFKAVRELAAKMTWGQWATFMDEFMVDPDVQGLRHWLAGDHDPDSDTAKANRRLLMTSEAAELLDVERQRLHRWEKQGRIRRVLTTPSGPLYYRGHVMALKAEEDERGGRRSRGVAAEPAEA